MSRLDDLDEQGVIPILERSVRDLLRREPDFRPTPAQLVRYEAMPISDELLAELRRRAGADACSLAEMWERQGT